ncbi:S-adenosyl-L-methionine-dependent methyltransferase [Infundibulicybe gibba]|nr:S-adenosyl-L-methionine-dependent methyltransferase [Infundibulicybe gibba]
MPRATTDRFSRAHQPSAKASSSSDKSNGDSSSGRNPIFNTERFGQHILKNPLVAQGIVDKVTPTTRSTFLINKNVQANLKPTDKVLEVGPGTGNLTVRILNKQNIPEQRKLDIIIGDFVKADLPYFDVCISNTPYQISSPLIFRLLSHRPLPRVCILMFQREFALRLVARPSTNLWSRLSANVQLYAKVDHIMKVGKNSFRPAPMVESSVVRVVPRDPPPPVRFEEFDGLGRILFSRRNKTVHGNFMAKGVIEMLEKNWRTWCAERDQMVEDNVNMKAKIEKVLDDTGNTENRAAKMDIDDLLKLLSAFHDVGIHFA